jgi:hypothetical protein
VREREREKQRKDCKRELRARDGTASFSQCDATTEALQSEGAKGQERRDANGREPTILWTTGVFNSAALASDLVRASG